MYRGRTGNETSYASTPDFRTNITNSNNENRDASRLIRRRTVPRMYTKI